MVNKLTMRFFAMSIVLFFITNGFAGVVHISSAGQFDNLMKEKQLVVAKFEAPWCGPCQASKQPFADVAQEIQNSAVAFAGIDIEKHEDIAKKYNVSSIPTIVYFVQGKEQSRSAGFSGTADFKKTIHEKVAQFTGMSAPSSEQEGSMPMEEPMSSDSSFFAKIITAITSIITGIIDIIRDAITWIFDKIRGIF